MRHNLNSPNIHFHCNQWPILLGIALQPSRHTACRLHIAGNHWQRLDSQAFPPPDSMSSQFEKVHKHLNRMLLNPDHTLNFDCIRLPDKRVKWKEERYMYEREKVRVRWEVLSPSQFLSASFLLTVRLDDKPFFKNKKTGFALFPLHLVSFFLSALLLLLLLSSFWPYKHLPRTHSPYILVVYG